MRSNLSTGLALLAFASFAAAKPAAEEYRAALLPRNLNQTTLAVTSTTSNLAAPAANLIHAASGPAEITAITPLQESELATTRAAITFYDTQGSAVVTKAPSTIVQTTYIPAVLISSSSISLSFASPTMTPSYPYGSAAQEALTSSFPTTFLTKSVAKGHSAPYPIFSGYFNASSSAIGRSSATLITLSQPSQTAYEYSSSSAEAPLYTSYSLESHISSTSTSYDPSSMASYVSSSVASYVLSTTKPVASYARTSAIISYPTFSYKPQSSTIVPVSTAAPAPSSSLQSAVSGASQVASSNAPLYSYIQTQSGVPLYSYLQTQPLPGITTYPVRSSQIANSPSSTSAAPQSAVETPQVQPPPSPTQSGGNLAFTPISPEMIYTVTETVTERITVTKIEAPTAH